MRSRLLVGFGAVVLAQVVGCCRCCGDRDLRLPRRDTFRDDRLLDPSKNEGPPPVIQPGPNTPPVSGAPKQTGAYGGVN